MQTKPYFVGIALPPELDDPIRRFQVSHYDPEIMKPPLTPHITLLHPNALSEIHSTYILPKIKQAAGRFLPLSIRLHTPELLGDSLLYCPVESSVIESLQQTLVSLLPSKIQAAHYVGKDFMPHVTLLQAAPRQKLPAEISQAAVRQLGGHIPTDFTAIQLSVFSWQGPRRYHMAAL